VVFPLIDSNSVFMTDPMRRIFTLYASLRRPSSRLGHKLNHGYFPAILAKSNSPPISSDPYPMQQQQTKCGIQSVILHKKLIITTQILKTVYLPPDTTLWLNEKFRLGGVKVCLFEYVYIFLKCLLGCRRKRRNYQRSGKLPLQREIVKLSMQCFLPFYDVR
jgi:hypothetical protein